MNQIGSQGCILQLYEQKQVRFIVVDIDIEEQEIFINTYHNFVECKSEFMTNKSIIILSR